MNKLTVAPDEGGVLMEKNDYDRALFCTHRSDWDNLTILMVQTKDQFLSKKIEHFLHVYHFETDYTIVQAKLYSLFRYLDHATECTYVNDIFWQKKDGRT